MLYKKLIIIALSEELEIFANFKIFMMKQVLKALKADNTKLINREFTRLINLEFDTPGNNVSNLFFIFCLKLWFQVI